MRADSFTVSRKNFIQRHAGRLAALTSIDLLLVGRDAHGAIGPQDLDQAGIIGTASHHRVAVPGAPVSHLLESQDDPVLVCRRNHQSSSSTQK